MTEAQQTALDENGWHKCSEFRPLYKNVINDIIYIWHHNQKPEDITPADYWEAMRSPREVMPGFSDLFGWYWNYDNRTISDAMRELSDQAWRIRT